MLRTHRERPQLTGGGGCGADLRACAFFWAHSQGQYIKEQPRRFAHSYLLKKSSCPARGKTFLETDLPRETNSNWKCIAVMGAMGAGVVIVAAVGDTATQLSLQNTSKCRAIRQRKL